MKAQRFAHMRPIHAYIPGDLLLESERIAAAGPVTLSVPPAGGPPASSVLDIIKPAKDDYPALTKALQVMKFKPEDLAAYHEAIGSIINLATGIIWGAGAVLAVADILGKMMGEKPDEATQRLRHITMRVDQIYGYLAAQEKKGLHLQATAWRGTLDSVRNAVNNARISRSPSNLEALRELKETIDGDLGLMLDPKNAEIAFQRATYAYFPYGHWIDTCTPGFTGLADGTPLHYRDPAQELQATIWDPGHYIDVLLNALSDRLLLLVTTEPAFRSTFYDMAQVRNLLEKLTLFLQKWRGSMIVADPLAGLNGGGPLQNPLISSPLGIAIGAVEPVTGLGFFDAYWADFTILEIWEGSIAAKGKPDETRAKDPQLALARALDLHPRLLDGAVKASGIGRLAELRARLQDLLAWPSIGSDFVDLPNANFHLVAMTGPAAGVEKVDLGFIGQYSKNPGKKYDGRRYVQTFEKRFRFAMAMRADVSLVQIGYRIEIGGHSLPLIPFSVAPAAGAAPRFPTQPLALDIREDEGAIYDVYQSAIFNQADEDVFEGAEPPAGISKFAPGPKLSQPERLFLNERKGPIALRVQVTFEADLNSPNQPFAGFATVSIKNLDPDRARGGVILSVTVYETRVVDKHGRTEEFIADRMTIHLVPSFFVVGREYFEDRRQGMEAIDTIFGGISDRYAISVQQLIPVGPEWQIRRRAVEEVVKVQAIQQFEREEPEVAEQVLKRFQIPKLRS